MSRNTDLSEAIQNLKLTLPEMSKRKIATTPENYAVWYEYTIGKNLALRTTIGELDRKQSEYTETVNQDLYRRFILCGEEQAEVNKLKDGVRKLIVELLENLSQEGEDLKDFSRTLVRFNDQVESVSSTEGLQTLIKELLTETRKREEATLSLQNTVTSLASDIKDLREEMGRLHEEANTDSLTRLRNRRAFDIEMGKAMGHCAAEKQPMTLILVDIDHFKNFNDQHGHAIGDKVLRYVANMLTQSVRGSDLAARIGGEEFGLILPETDYDGAMSVADNLCRKIARQPLSDSKENKKLGSLTVSAGVALYHLHESAEDLLRRADACLYQSKRDGRDRVTGEKDLREQPSNDVTWI